MKLSHLCACLGAVPSGPGDAEIRGLTCDSRQVEPGYLFAALPGARANGLDHLPQALERGAAALLTEGPLEAPVPVVSVPDARRALALLAAEFYGHPAEKLTLVGITGTKGKTTTAHILKSILEAAGEKTAMSGTLGGFIGGGQVLEPGNTTPEPVTLHRFFAQAAEKRCTHLVMEVSSQGLKQERVSGVDFDLALFLNLSPDHIGGAEHRDFAEYLHCKSLLFRQCGAALANSDDPHWRQVLAGCAAAVTTFGFSPGADVRGGAVRPFREGGVLGCEFSVYGWAEPLRVSLPGPYNAADALAAAAAAQVLGVPEAAVREGLRTVRVPGRAELLPLPDGVTAVIDYAHNGASFESILSTLADYDHERLIVVFGAGGNRPKMRRRDMAEAAAKYAHFAVVTADNPRWERVEDICGDIGAVLEGRIPCRVIYDRAEAVRYALDMARPGDIVALLGKGHEAYIESRGRRLPFSERAVVEEWAANRRKGDSSG